MQEVLTPRAPGPAVEGPGTHLAGKWLSCQVQSPPAGGLIWAGPSWVLGT